MNNEVEMYDHDHTHNTHAVPAELVSEHLIHTSSFNSQRNKVDLLAVAGESHATEAFLRCERMESTNYVFSSQRVPTTKALPPSMPSTTSVTANNSLSRSLNNTEGQKYLLPQSAVPKVYTNQETSVDELADLFEGKCKISQSVSSNYSNLSFRDPGQHTLTSPVIPKEQYPGISLQDGGVKFVLRASPLTSIIKPNLLQSKNIRNEPKSAQILTKSEVSLESDVTANESLWRVALKPTRRRLHPSLSNEMAARRNPPSEVEDYRGLVSTKIEVVNAREMDEPPRRVRLGKVCY